MNGQTTRVRYTVLALACALSMITYLDRACFGQVVDTIANELSFGVDTVKKWTFTAFAISYALFEIPSGWLGDVWGPRRALLRIVTWWSICTALTGLVAIKVGPLPAGGLGLLVSLRFLFGAGEAGAYPNITRALHNWIPVGQSATAQGWVWMSGRLMGGLTPLIWTFLVIGTSWTAPLVTWRVAFALFGLIGLTWCAVFAFWFRDHPRIHPAVNEAELVLIETGRVTDEAKHEAPPLGHFLRSRNLWLLCIMYFCMVYGWYFNITYLPAYLLARFQLDPKNVLIPIYQGSPLWIGAFSCLAGGMLVDRLIRRTGDRKRSRRIVGVTAELLAGVGWLAAIVAPNVHVFFIAISLAALCNDATLASAWATCQDIGQRYTAMTAACMNTVGTIGAAVAGWVTGTIVEQALASRAASLHVAVDQLGKVDAHDARMSGYNWCLLSYAIAYFISAVCWRFIDPTKPIVDSSPSGPSV